MTLPTKGGFDVGLEEAISAGTEPEAVATGSISRYESAGFTKASWTFECGQGALLAV